MAVGSVGLPLCLFYPFDFEGGIFQSWFRERERVGLGSGVDGCAGPWDPTNILPFCFKCFLKQYLIHSEHNSINNY